MRSITTPQYHKTGYLSRLALASALATAAFAGTTKATAAADQDMWILNQHSQLAGDQIVYVSTNAVRIENYAHSYVILLRAPDWKVLIYNSRSKKACTKEVKDFVGTLGFGSGMMGEGYLQALPLKKQPEETTFKGLKALRYYTGKLAGPAPGKANRSADVTNSIFGSTYLESADYWLWPSGTASTKAGLVLQRIYRIPRRAGTPLSLKYTSVAGQKYTEIDTLSVSKSKVRTDKFTAPKGLIAAKSEEEVVFDDQKKKKFNRAAEMFDSWRDTWGRE